MNVQFKTALPTPPGIAQEALDSIREAFISQWQQLTHAAANQQLPAIKDKRFANEDWSANPASLMMAHMYLLSGQTVQRMVEACEVAPELKERLKFSMMQWVDAMSPANFLLTNPEAQRKLVESGGDSLVAGMTNLLGDLQKGRITQTDESKFQVGQNVATTSGAVVYQNQFFQLIQYAPVTATVHVRPILLVPPCINKFYVLDLQPDNSVVQYLLSQGFSVFMVSWRNPLEGDEDGIQKATWDDYLEQGVLQAIAVTQAVSGQAKINALGFCVGGTMLATALAIAAARGQESVASVTLLTSMIDFGDTGVLGVFVDPQHVRMREQQLANGGLMSARELGTTFSFLRPNELVWNYVVANYLKGEKPPAFDLLYWNSDSTNLPGPFFTWYFRNTYLENNLCKPQKLICAGETIDFSKITIPAYLYGSREDHIVPWVSAYASTKLLAGENRFVLGASGHIAGVINPPAKNKRSYWVDESDTEHDSAENWLAGATEYPGSWWSDWAQWLASHSGRKVKAKQNLGSAEYPSLESAPGSYVLVRAV